MDHQDNNPYKPPMRCDDCQLIIRVGRKLSTGTYCGICEPKHGGDRNGYHPDPRDQLRPVKS